MKWPQVELQHIALQEKGAIVSGPFGSNISAKYFVDEGIPVIRGNNLTKGREKFIDDGFAYLTETKAAEFRNCMAVTDDIIFTAAGSIGQVGIIPPNARYGKYVISNKQLRVRLDSSRVNPNYIYAWLSSVQMVRYLENMNNGGAVPLLNLGIIRRVPVPLPPVATQDRIADILSAYDDLIENNRRRIALLEEAARLLYREWFVYFRFPGYKHVSIANGVPRGWERPSIREIAELRYGRALKKENRIKGAVPVYGSSGIVGSHRAALAEGPAIVVGRKGNVGSIYWCQVDFWPIDTVYFIPKEQVDFWLYLALPSAGFQNTDASVPGLNRDYAYSRRLTSPPTRLRRLFNEAVEPMIAHRWTLEIYNQKLAEARDLLLPRLMNGEIAV